MIRLFTMKDYDEVYQLWKSTPGVGLRSLDDSREGIEQFIKRNPTTNFVAEAKFWSKLDWTLRKDLNYYTISINHRNE